MFIFIICASCCIIGWVACFIWCMLNLKPYECEGEIVMHGDELYLAITEKDKEALETKNYAKLRLVRKDFKGFSET